MIRRLTCDNAWRRSPGACDATAGWPRFQDEVMDRLEPLTRRYYQEFNRCPDCGRIYWAGSHHARLVRQVERLLDRLATDAAPGD